MSTFVKLLVIVAMIFGAYRWYAGPAWVTVKSDSYGYKVAFPIAPEHHTQEAKNAISGTFTIDLYGANHEKVALAAMTYDLSKSSDEDADLGTKSVITAVKRQLTQTTGAEITETKTVSINGVSGEEITVSLGDKGVMIQRYFKRGKLMFNLTGTYPNGSDEKKKEVKRFLDSFSLI